MNRANFQQGNRMLGSLGGARPVWPGQNREHRGDPWPPLCWRTPPDAEGE